MTCQPLIPLPQGARENSFSLGGEGQDEGERKEPPHPIPLPCG